MLLVFFFHLDAQIRVPFVDRDSRIVGPALAFVRAGHSGVDLFFVLSGFLLSLPFLRQAAGGNAVSVRRYFGRRALRILPLYYVAVVAATVLSARVPTDLWRGFPYLFFLNGFPGLTTHLPPYSNVWWSLATEAQFYLLLPLLPFALASRRGRVCGAIILATWGAAYAAFLTRRIGADTIQGEIALGISLFGRAPAFLSGIGAAWLFLHCGVLRTRFSGSAVLRNGGADAALLAVLTGLAYLLRWVTFLGPQDELNPPYHAWHAAAALLWAMILLLLLVAPLRIKALFSNPVLNRFGVLSYSMYIWHVPLFVYGLRVLLRIWNFDFGWNAATVGVAALLCVVCTGLSEVTYRTIERPFLVRKQRLQA
jgi:peptidoglycan/LPS O-acetylase OafA/YrhL